jgi:hypothetical protein
VLPQADSTLAVSPCTCLEREVIDVNPFQIWDVRENEKAPWREAKVINVRRDSVELQFLDMPNAPEIARTFNASLKRMLSDRQRYRFVREPK